MQLIWVAVGALLRAQGPRPDPADRPRAREDHVLTALAGRGPRVVSRPAYHGELQLGTPPQTVTVLFDTGSGSIVVPDASCATKACGNRDKYFPRHSESARDINRDGSEVVGELRDKVTIDFGSGRVRGVYVEDEVCVAHDACSRVRLVAATDLSDGFLNVPFDGIVGLGFADLSAGAGFGLLDALVAAKQVKRRVFALFLSDEVRLIDSNEITLGGYRPERLAEPRIVWAPVARASFWELAVDDLKAGPVGTGLCRELFGGPCRVVVDSGTNHIAGPARLREKLLAAVPLRSDCSNYHVLPQLGLQLGADVLEISPAQYVTDRHFADGESAVEAAIRAAKGEPHCELLYLPHETDEDLLIFGEPLLRSYYTIFDQEQRRLGFGKPTNKVLPVALAHANVSDPLVTIPLQRANASAAR